MIDAIAIEWMKFSKYKGVRVLLLLYAVLLPAMLLLPNSIPLPGETDYLESFYMFPNIFKYGGYLASWLVFGIVGFIGVVMITSEIQHKTLRQNIITGMSRRRYFLGKLSFALSIAALITCYFIFVCLVLGFFNTNAVYFSKILEGGPVVLGLFMQCFAYLTFAILIGLLIRRTGVALFLFFAYTLIEVIIRYGIHSKFTDGPSIKYYPFNVFEDLVPVPSIPFIDSIGSISDDAGLDLALSQPTAMVFALIYIAIFAYAGYWKLNRDDL